MKKLFFISLVCFFVQSIYSFAQVSVKGMAIDSSNKSPLISASVLLEGAGSDARYFALTGKSGDFELKNVREGKYLLKISYVGYLPLEKQVRVGKQDISLGKLGVAQTDIKTKPVIITGKSPIGELKNDTVVFNSKSYITQPDATTEDLIKKMPGVQVESDGSVKSQGEDVKKVLVDGKPFFGDDPTLALRNLPADVVDRIQIFDKMSDQAEFTGFDDGQTAKAMNIITKQNKRTGQFGRINAGYGNDDRYTASLNLNHFGGDQRLSILGLSNNVNQQNFAMQDIMDMYGSGGGGRFGRAMMGRMGGGPPPGGARIFRTMSEFRPSSMQFNPADYFTGQLDGLSTTHAIGANYSDTWWEKVDISGSYFYNYTQNDNNSNLTRDYLLEPDSLRNYAQDNSSNSRNINHRFNMKLNWQIDSLNSIMLRPNLSVQANEMGNDMFGQSFLGDTLPVSSTRNIYSSNYSGFNFSNDLLLRHKFYTPGRTVSLMLSTSMNDKEGSGFQTTLNRFQSGSAADSAKLRTQSPLGGYGLTANAVYTEPIHAGGQMQIAYSISYNSNNSDKKAYDFNYVSNEFAALDTILSNKYNNNYTTNKGSIGYNLKSDNNSLQANIDYQRTDLSGSQVFPYNFAIDYSFNNVLPSLRYNYKFSKTANLMAFYRTSTNVPSVSQLQNVVDISNPLEISTGNQSLRQQYSHLILTRYSEFSSDFSSVFMTMFSLIYRTDYIANSTVYAPVSHDTLAPGNIRIPAGGRLTTPVNMDGYIFANAFVTYGLPLDFIKTNLNINLGGNYTRSPSMVNNLENYSNAYNVNLMLVLSSNISQDLDFTVSSRANFTITKNTIHQELDNNYNSYLNSLSLKWVVWEGIFLQSELRSQVYTGLVQDDNSYTILNLGLGKKLFGNLAEIKLTLNDALNQNKSIQTNVTDSYIEYSRSQTLKQYLMLSLTMNLGRFERPKERDFRPDGPPPGRY